MVTRRRRLDERIDMRGGDGMGKATFRRHCLWLFKKLSGIKRKAEKGGWEWPEPIEGADALRHAAVGYGAMTLFAGEDSQGSINSRTKY